MTYKPEVEIQFPKDFLLGSASSAHQVEGNNKNSDWWHYEELGKVPKSGLATDHYNRFDEDFAIAQSIGLNAMRISIEWARIEPTPGTWDMEAVEHYRKVLQSMKQRGLKRMVTLQHFTLPWWLASCGGFLVPNAVDLFARYCAFVVEQLDDEVELWCTINEPQIYVLMTHIWALHPPFKKKYFQALRIIFRLIACHKAAYQAIKAVRPSSKIGIAQNNVYDAPARKSVWSDRIAVAVMKYFGNHFFLDQIADYQDFIGLNYYFSHVVKFSLEHGYQNINTTEPMSDMGWRTYPEGIYHLLLDLKQYKKPIYITENGIANARDDMRQRFIFEHLEWTKKAMDEGADVRGYFYWTLVDNYEWHDGFGPKFGLVELNNETLARKVRPSAEIFKQIKVL